MTQHADMWHDAKSFISMLAAPKPPDPAKPPPADKERQAERDVTEAITMCYQVQHRR